MSPQSRPLTIDPSARSPFFTRALVITLLLSVSVAVVVLASVSASGPRHSRVEISQPNPQLQRQSQSNLPVSFRTANPFVNAPLATLCVNPGGTGGCFGTIQAAVNAAANGDTINVEAGTYVEDVAIPVANLSLLGFGPGTKTISGAIGGSGSTISIGASNVTVAGFTITREGNNLLQWNDAGLNSAGISIQGQALTGALIRDNLINVNRTGIDINNSNGHTIRNNVIDDNRTGLIFRNQTDQMTVVENFVTNNWTVGILFLDASGGSNVPVQSALHGTFSNNSLSGNWYGQIVDRQSGGTLPAPGTTNLKNFRGNWFGTTSPVVTTANSAEPGYAAQIPPSGGGTATAPGGQPDIAGPASANFQYTPLLLVGTDTNIETTPGRGTFGFQGVQNKIIVTPANQNGWVFFDDFPGMGTGSGGFEAGPGTPPLGLGSAFLEVDANGRHAFATAGYGGTRMDDITGLSYYSYQTNNVTVANSLQFDMDYDLNDPSNTFQGRLVFEPYLTPAQGAVQQNVWQSWDARAGNWYGTRTTVIVNNVAGVTQPCLPASPCTWAQVLALFPNAGVRNTTTSLMLFKAGGPWAPGFRGNVDDFRITQNTSQVTYDFDPFPSLSINDVTHNEGNAGTTTYTFNVTLSIASAQTVTVDYATADSTAFAPFDYTSIPTTQIIFNPGETSKPVTVNVNGDLFLESNETFFVNLSNPNANAIILDGQGAGNITNDDVACVTPATVYVDDSWIGTAPGTDPDAGGPATNFGCDSFATIQDGVTAVPSSGTVIVRAGTYTEVVTINKIVTLNGAQAGVNPNDGSWNDTRTNLANESIIHGAVNLSLRNNIVMDGFTVERTATNEGHILIGSGNATGVGTSSSFNIKNNRFVGTRNTASPGSPWAGIHTNFLSDGALPGAQFTSHQNRIEIAGTASGSGILINANLPGTDGLGATTITATYVANSPGNGFNVNRPGASALISGNRVVNDDIFTFRANNTVISGNTISDAPQASISNTGGSTTWTASNNTIISPRAQAFLVGSTFTVDPVSGMTISGNIVTVDPALVGVGVTTVFSPLQFALVDIRGNLTGTNVATNNSISLSSNPRNPAVVGVFGLRVRGNVANLSVTNNTFDGNGVGGAGDSTVPASSGVFLDNDAVTTSLDLKVQNNLINGWVNGVSIFDTIPGAPVVGVPPVQIISNTIRTNTTGVRVQGQGLANLNLNRIVGNSANGTNNVDGTVTAENNWWGCNAGPGNGGCDSVLGTVDFDPWIVLRVSATPNSIPQGGNSTVTAEMKHNSLGADTSGSGTVPQMPVTFSATEGTMAPPTGTITAGQAMSTFTSTSSSGGTACAMVDNQLICTNVSVQQMIVTIPPAETPTAADNDYTRINNAIQSSFAGQTIILNGAFNWTEANAAASWALGSDGIAATADDYSILVPANLNNVTLTANNLGDAVIQGPGDLAAVNFEGVLVFDGADNQNWKISNLRFLDFDLSIGMFAGAGGTDAHNNTQITNNYIRIARDLNTIVAPADVNQNIGIHFSFGMNQLISGNTIEIQGNAVSNGGNFATDVGMQSNTSGGNVYDGLQITNNIIRVLNAQDANNPQVILGIWENAHGHTSNITVSGNQFINQAAGNNAATNLQRGFRVTSHSSATTTVIYQNNRVTGANIGFQWLAGSNFAGNQPVKLISNTINNNQTGVLVQSQGLANLSFNRIVGNSLGINNVDGTVTAENNWWGCNAGPGNAGCDGVLGTVDFNPWLVLGISASPGTVIPGGTSTITVDMTHNSDALVPSATIFVPPTPVTFGATQGTMTPPSGTLTSGQATSTFTSTSGISGTASGTVDNQTVSTPITVTALPTFTINDVTHLEGNGGTTAYTFTVTKTGSTALNATVDYATVPGTATAPSDFTAIPTTTLTFLPADTTKQFTVLVNGDTTLESDEAFTVHLSSAVNSTISDADGTGTITNDDTDVTVAVAPSAVTEDGATNLVYTFTRTGVTSGALTVNFSVGGTATLGTDYTPIGAFTFGPTSGTVNFVAGSSTATVTVDPAADATVEPDETVILTVTSGTGYNVGSPSAATGTITNSGDPDVTLAVSPASVSEDGVTNLVYTFTRTGVTSGVLTVNFSVGGTATFVTDYTPTGALTFGPTSGSVTFGAGNSTATVTIDPVAELASEADETVVLTVTSGTDYHVASPSAATGTITNDDTDVTLAVSPPSVSEDGATNLVYTFTRTGVTSGTLTVNFSVAGDATLGTDYTQTGAATFTSSSGTVNFGAGNSTATVTVDPSIDLAFETNETVILTVTSGTGYSVGSPSQGIGTITNDDAAGGIIRFTSATYNTTESSGSTTITVERTGDTTQAVTVDYATPDDSEATTAVQCSTINGLASPRCDFTTALGTLRFAAGETSKTFTVMISQDNFVEGPETLSLTLSNLTGGAAFGVPSTATLTIADDASEPGTSPIDDAQNFVRQHYHDFLNREPDSAGLAFWTNQITSCGADAQCIETKRIHVSASFFLSIEFQDTGYLVERLYKASYGDVAGNSTIGGAHTLPVPIVEFSEFLPDTQKLSQGVIVGQPGWEAVLEINKQAFVAEFVQRTRFATAYPTSLTPAVFVDALFANTGVTPTATDRNAAINEFGAAVNTTDLAARGRALRRVAENSTLKTNEVNRAFVLMQFFGYLRRNPNAAPDTDHSGYDFWLTKLNQFNGDFIQAEMVKGFLSSIEYRHRFGP